MSDEQKGHKWSNVTTQQDAPWQTFDCTKCGAKRRRTRLMQDGKMASGPWEYYGHNDDKWYSEEEILKMGQQVLCIDEVQVLAASQVLSKEEVAMLATKLDRIADGVDRLAKTLESVIVTLDHDDNKAVDIMENTLRSQSSSRRRT